MNDTVECPYCEHENDMSDGTVDLPSDNKFDHECENCEQEFEVFVEFYPSYSSEKIVYEKCGNCGKEDRDLRRKGSSFPYPDSLKGDKVCTPCLHKAIIEEYSKSNKEVN